MKKIIFLALILPFLTLAQSNRPDKVSKSIAEAKAVSGEFQTFEIFNPQTTNALTDHSEAVKDGVVFTIDQPKVNDLLNQNPKQINLSIPFKSNGETVALDLIQVAVFSPDFKAMTNAGQDITNEVDFGKHYRGVIAGDNNSLVSISIFDSQVTGFIANDEGNYTIGKLKNSDTDHIIYLNSDLNNKSQGIFCSTQGDDVGYTEEELTPPLTMQEPGDEIDVYIESGKSVYDANGGNLANTVVFIAAIFAQSYVLYANDGILVRTSSMMVWVTPDPYDGADSFAQLSRFTTFVNTNDENLNGDIAHLVERQNYGGVAWLDGMCSSSNVCYSGLDSLTVINVPNYSWNVMVITHEMGHLMGSNHTHACVWNGDNTAIDGCAPTEGGCPRPGNPPTGGTIMSYCHLTNGINFNNGFGPQPTAVILNKIANAGGCLDPEDVSNPPVAVCKTHIVTLDANGDASITVADIEGGSYDDDGIVSMTIDIDTFDCDDVGLNNVTLTVTDTDGLSTSCVGIVEVIDDGGTPVITCPDDITVEVPAGETYELLDFQNDITIVTANCNVNPAATNQNPSVGTQLPIGVHEITISALLNDGSVLICTFEITVEEEILGLADNSILASLTLSPNPAVETVFLNNPENLELESMSIFDMLGRFIKLIDLKEMGNEQSIDVSELSESNYFVIIQGTQNKIVKQLIIR